MVRKFFPLDKNYLLEEAQLLMQDRLLSALIIKAKKAYQLLNNPLGLNDELSDIIGSYQPRITAPLTAFYQTLSGIYRYKYGETQLEFLWDGRDHRQKYIDDWSSAFHEWTTDLCRRTQFIQAVLDLTVFLPEGRQEPLAENRMNAVMLDLFEVKLHKSKGIVRMNVA